MRTAEAVFVDTGAWIALAQTRDPLHARAKETWDLMESMGARTRTSIPVVLETFTFLERNTTRDVALAWKDSLDELPRFELLECTSADVKKAWSYFRRRDLHKLSAVDATSFVVMAKSKIRVAFTFDHHFATAGFRIVG
jgi:predicted nucleic acid-binding protein